MTNEEYKQFTSDKWLYYQDVKRLKIKVKTTEEDKKKIEQFRKFINEKKDTK